jgi:hypothetical protein
MQLAPDVLAFLDTAVQNRTITAAQLMALFHHQQHTGIQMGNIPVPDYITDADLPQMWAALDWWPKQGLPSTHDFSTLDRISLFSVYIPGIGAPIRAMELLVRKSGEVSEYLNAGGSSVVNPNESAEERKSRKAREAQKRWRDKQRTHTDPAIENARIAYVKAYAAFQNVCAERKQAELYFTRKIQQATHDYKTLQAEYDKLRK